MSLTLFDSVSQHCHLFEVKDISYSIPRKFQKAFYILFKQGDISKGIRAIANVEFNSGQAICHLYDLLSSYVTSSKLSH